MSCSLILWLGHECEARNEVRDAIFSRSSRTFEARFAFTSIQVWSWVTMTLPLNERLNQRLRMTSGNETMCRLTDISSACCIVCQRKNTPVIILPELQLERTGRSLLPPFPLRPSHSARECHSSKCVSCFPNLSIANYLSASRRLLPLPDEQLVLSDKC